MSSATTEERLSFLEERLAVLQQQVDERLLPPHSISDRPKRGWQAVVGTFSNDPLYEEAMRLGQKWRDRQRVSETEEEP